MLILFSQGPTTHSRIGNSLLWMSRAMQAIREDQKLKFHFPWAFEKFRDFLTDDSPWLSSIYRANAARIFSDLLEKDLTIASLESTSMECIRLIEDGGNNIQPGPCDDSYLLKRNGLNLVFAHGGRVGFDHLIKQDTDIDIIIIHEPFQIVYSGERFPTDGIEHIHPKEKIELDSINFISTTGENGTYDRRVGLHIRRGDYKDWRSGDYFYSDGFWLVKAKELLSANAQVYIYSNEQDSLLCQKMQALGCVLSKGSPSEDLSRMTYMDEVIGPPSTFPIVARMLAESKGRKLDYTILGDRHQLT